MKMFYEDYVNHMLRFYARHYQTIDINKATEVDKLNWTAVDKVLHTTHPWQREAILEVFERRDDLTDNVYEVSKKQGIKQDDLWILLSKITRKIAKERGLI